SAAIPMVSQRTPSGRRSQDAFSLVPRWAIGIAANPLTGTLETASGSAVDAEARTRPSSPPNSDGHRGPPTLNPPTWARPPGSQSALRPAQLHARQAA